MYPDPPQPSGEPFQGPPQLQPGYGFRNEPESVGAVGGAVGGATGGSGRASAQKVSVGPEETAKAQKLCKFASSALDYGDAATAVDYLQQAINLLTTSKN